MGVSTKCCSIDNGALEPEAKWRRVGDVGTTDHLKLMSADSQGLIADPECECSGCDMRDKEMSTGSMDQMKRRKTGGGTGYRRVKG